MNAVDVLTMAPIPLLFVFSLGSIAIGIKYMTEDSQ
jgi:hypothetical protein